jgi:hypothetical protein
VNAADMKKSDPRPKWYVVLLALVALATPLSANQPVTLTWDASPDATVVGYRLYVAVAGASNRTALDVGKHTDVTLTNLLEATSYLFQVTAYNEDGIESDPSNALICTVPLGALKAAHPQSGQARTGMNVVVPAVANKAVTLQVSTDLVHWKDLVTGEVGAPVSYQVNNTMPGALRFYRSVCLP